MDGEPIGVRFLGENKVSQVVDQIVEKLGGFGSAVDKVRGTIGGIGLAAGTFLFTALDAFEKSTNAAKDLSRVLGSSVEEASKLIEVADDMGVSASALSSALGIFQKRLSGVGDVEEYFAQQTEKSKEKVDDLLFSVRMSEEKLAKLFEQKRAGTKDIDSLNTSIEKESYHLKELKEKLAKAVEEFEEGGKQAKGFKGALKELNIEFVDSAGKTKPMTQILGEISDRFAQMPDSADKSRLAIQLFGSQGRALLPILNLGSKEMEAMAKEAEELGLVITDKDVKASREMAIALDKLGDSFRSFQFNAIKPIIPLLTAFEIKVAEVGAGVAKASSPFGELIGKGLALTAVFGTLLGGNQFVYNLLTGLDAVVQVAVQFKFLFGWLGIIIAAIGLFAYAWKTNFLGIKDFLSPTINEMLKKLGEIVGFFQDLINSKTLDEAIAKVKTKISEIFGADVVKTLEGRINGIIGTFNYFKSVAEAVFAGDFESAGKRVNSGLMSLFSAIGLDPEASMDALVDAKARIINTIESIKNSFTLLTTGNLDGGIFGLDEDHPFLNALRKGHEIIQSFREAWNVLVSAFAGDEEAIKKIYNAVNDFFSALFGKEDFLGQLQKSFEDTIKNVGAAFIILKTNLESVIGPFDEVGKHFETFGGFLNEHIIPLLIRVGETILRAFGEIAIRIGPALSGILVIASLVFSGIVGVVAAAVQFVIDRWRYFGHFFQGLWEFIEGIVRAAWVIINGIIKVALDLLAGNFDKAGEDIIMMFIELGPPLEEALGGLWKMIQAGVLAIIGWLLIEFAKMGRGITEKITESGRLIVKAVLSIVTDVGTILGEFPARVMNWGGEIVTALADGIRGKINEVATALTGIRDLLPASPAKTGPLAFMPNWDWIFEGLRLAIEGAKTLLGGGLDIIARLLGFGESRDASSAVQPMIDSISNAFDEAINVWSRIMGTLPGRFAAVLTIMSVSLNAFVSSWQQSVSSFSSSWLVNMNLLSQYTVMFITQLMTNFNLFLTYIATAWVPYFNQLPAIIARIFNVIFDYFASVSHAFYDYGLNFMEQMAAGIANGTPAVENALSRLSENLPSSKPKRGPLSVDHNWDYIFEGLPSSILKAQGLINAIPDLIGNPRGEGTLGLATGVNTGGMTVTVHHHWQEGASREGRDRVERAAEEGTLKAMSKVFKQAEIRLNRGH